MATLRRQVKNMVKNYSEAEVKVRDATSNDPWGPSSTLMGEISDLTYNIVALGEVMRMIWKRLNDHGKNWRHVYKSLVLLDYLIKNGNEKVAQQCKEHIVAIQTLKDFQHLEEQKDQGQSVREKAKSLVSLLRDDERLKAERAKAFKARERYAQNAMGISSDNKMVYASGNPSDLTRHLGGSSGSNRSNSSYTDPYGGASATPVTTNGATRNALSPDLEAVRPSDPNEEDLQIKLAIMLSQQEQEEEAQRKRSDEAKLQIALEQSKTEGQPNGLVDLGENLFNDTWQSNANSNANKTNEFESNNDDIFASFSAATGKSPVVDPWSLPSSLTSLPSTAPKLVPLNTSNQKDFDPWKTPSSNSQSTNPWLPTPNAPSNSTTITVDPWAIPSANKADDFDLFTADRSTPAIVSGPANTDPFGDFFGASASTGSGASNKQSTNPWNIGESTSMSTSKGNSFDPFSSNSNSNVVPQSTTNKPVALNPMRKTPESFLGENSSLVNLENLIPARPKSTNPFSSAISTSITSSSLSGGGTGNMSSSTSIGQLNNPFLAQQQNNKGPTINQLQQQSMFQFNSHSSTPTPPPLIPSNGQLAQPLIIPPVSQMPMSFNMSANSGMPFTSQATQSLFPSLSSTALTNNNMNAGANGSVSTNPFLMM